MSENECKATVSDSLKTKGTCYSKQFDAKFKEIILHVISEKLKSQ